jgi:GTPase SAR1 family protein
MEKNRARYSPYPREPEPFNFYEQYRMRHQWVLGDSGSGKTTFLANLIAEDLDKVAQGKASVVVLDSQDDELARYLPRDRRFAPGGDLHERLVYLEYDPKFPLAFNIFANPDAAELCDFVMKSVIGADVTMKQNVFYEYLLTVASIIPGANIYTVQDLLRPDGHKLFGPYLNKLDARSQQWLRTRFDADIFGQTKEEILYRLEAFTSPRNILGNMLASTEDKFDLGKEIQAGKVVVLNTNRSKLGKQGTRALGRFFIFKVLQAMEDRMDIDRSARLPAFFYIDEATDYIEDDDSLPDLLEKARKQKIGLIIAHQRTGEGSRISKNVQAALSGIYIQARLFQPKTATVTLKDSPTSPTVKDVAVPEIHFDRNQMAPHDWNGILTRMHEDFCYDPTTQTPPPGAASPPPGKKKRRTDSHDRP